MSGVRRAAALGILVAAGRERLAERQQIPGAAGQPVQQHDRAAAERAEHECAAIDAHQLMS